MYWFKSPSGKMFRGKKSALRFMESSKNCTSEDVRKFKSTQGTDKKFTKVIFYIFILKSETTLMLTQMYVDYWLTVFVDLLH